MLNSKLKEMKKLETLNNPKYSLTPEKMGKLVGGKQVVVSTGKGEAHYPGTSVVIHYSCDTLTYANEDDYNHDITSHEHWGCEGDPTYTTEYKKSTSK